MIQAIRQAKVECPRCHKILSAKPGIPDVECNCHTYCQYGTKPSDCTLMAPSSGRDPFSGKWKAFSGLHNSDVHEGDDTQARTYWCTVHEVYSSKVPFLVSVDWKGFGGKRASGRLRMSHGKY